MVIDRKSAFIGAGAVVTTYLVALVVSWTWHGENPKGPADRTSAGSGEAYGGSDLRPPQNVPHQFLSAQAVELSASEFATFNVRPITEREFAIDREAVGNIDFNRERSVDVFAPFAGKIIALFARTGDDVRKGQPLFTLDSPDLVQEESTLIAAAGTLGNTTRALERAKQLYQVQGVSQKDLDQATADQQAAEGALKAARDALRIFGKSEAEMDRIVTERKVDSVLVVHSPITGRISARNAAPGLFVQPGSVPAPYTVADLSSVWMVANVPEADFPWLAAGQELDVRVAAYPERVFRGRIVHIGAALDPNRRRIELRSEVRDPNHLLRPGMFARFVIRTGKPVRSPAVPYAGVVRESDGTMSVWVTTGGGHLVRRTVQVGLQQEGYTQILQGVRAGEQVATQGALFLSNALTAASR